MGINAAYDARCVGRSICWTNFGIFNCGRRLAGTLVHRTDFSGHDDRPLVVSLVAGVHWIGRHIFFRDRKRDDAIVRAVEQEEKNDKAALICLAGEQTRHPKRSKVVKRYVRLAQAAQKRWDPTVPGNLFKRQIAIKLSALMPDFAENQEETTKRVIEVAEAAKAADYI